MMIEAKHRVAALTLALCAQPELLDLPDELWERLHAEGFVRNALVPSGKRIAILTPAGHDHLQRLLA